MSEEGITYAEAGVDIEGEGKAIRNLVSSLVFRRQGAGSQVDIAGHFTGLIELGDHYLSMCTDGVGTKLIIAESLQKWDTVGIDCMAMNVNDLICIGAEPLAFVDYIASEEPDPSILADIGIGLNKGAELSNITIIGGETATLPEIVKGLDLAGTCLGYVNKDSLITGKDIGPGDLIIGLGSSGFHSNGYSLVRKVVQENDLSFASPLVEVVDSREWKGKRKFPDLMEEVEDWVKDNPAGIFGEILLEPTRIYVKDVLGLLKHLPAGAVKGMANITGGGFRNLSRMKDDVGFEVDDPLPVPPIIKMIQVLGGIDDREMFQTFNMGMGFVVVIGSEYRKEAMNLLSHMEAKVVGKVVQQSGIRIPGYGLQYDGYV